MGKSFDSVERYGSVSECAGGRENMIRIGSSVRASRRARLLGGDAMQARQFFVLSILMACAAALTAIVPKHALFNAPGGTTVLAVMAALAAVTATFLRRRPVVADRRKSQTD